MSTIALTFDDGPDPVWTERLLNRLKQLGAHATFFPIAQRAAAEPQLIARMLGDGHTVGLHCNEHVRHTDRNEQWLEQDTADALAILTELGAAPALWRTPWGITAPWTERIAAAHGLRLVDWDVDTHDWRGDDAQTMLAATQDHLTCGGVVLAHDGLGPGALRASTEQTVTYVELVARLAIERRMKLVALGSQEAP